MPPPSSGGIHIVQILNILENFDLQKYGFGSADAMQVMAEAEKHAYADRSEYLGDPDFVKVPWQALTSKAYAKAIAAGSTSIRRSLPARSARASWRPMKATRPPTSRWSIKTAMRWR